MTAKQALSILREAGEIGYSTPQRSTLAMIKQRTFDPLIKRACEKLMLVLVK